MAAKKIDLRFTVHSVGPGRFPARATVAGREVDVEVPGVIVELVSADGSMSQTLRLLPEDPEVAAEIFAVGEEVVATYTIPN
jgi:hypothetical protein